MPSFWTHYAFARECKKMLPSDCLAEAIRRHPHAYYTGMQGPDLFLFYLPTALRKKRVSTELHIRRPEKLLACIWRQASAAEGESRLIALAYAAGFLGHYCLDSETHPFVYAFSGIDRSAKSYCVHNALEADLNGLSVKRTFGQSVDTLALPDVYHLPPCEKAVVTRLLSRAINCVYKLNCTPATVSHALSAVRLSCHLLCDRSGMKAKLVRTLEKPIGLPCLSPLFLGTSRFYPDAANSEHRCWRDPYTGEESNTDFFALYDRAKSRYQYALETLCSLPSNERAAFFRSFCKRDFHGSPCI